MAVVEGNLAVAVHGQGHRNLQGWAREPTNHPNKGVPRKLKADWKGRVWEREREATKLELALSWDILGPLSLAMHDNGQASLHPWVLGGVVQYRLGAGLGVP